MNYLDLCKRVRQESGISGEGPSAVTGQTGILSRVVNWVDKANLDIQIAHDDWTFMWATATGTLQPNVSAYLGADLGMNNLYSLSNLSIGSKVVAVKDWNWWVRNIRRSNLTDKTGTPDVAVMSPDGKVHVWPKPDAQMTIVSDYYIKPVALVNNTDVSIIPKDYHQAIVERALMFYADYEEDQYLYQKKQIEYENWLGRMAAAFLPKVYI